MAKDPAFLFYTNDFLTGVQDLTMEERGQYITLLCLQHQKGHLTEKMIRLSCGNAAADVLSKFRQDDGGLFYNERLELEIEKRSAHGEKQKQRAIEGWKKRKESSINQLNNENTSESHGNAAALPLENENVIENRNENKDEIQQTTKKENVDWMGIFPFKSDEARKAVNDYSEHRKQLKIKRYTEIGWKQACKEWESWGEAVFIEAVYKAIANNWQGIFHPVKQSNNNSNGNNNQRTNGRIEPAPHGAEFGKFGANQ